MERGFYYLKGVEISFGFLILFIRIIQGGGAVLCKTSMDVFFKNQTQTNEHKLRRVEFK